VDDAAPPPPGAVWRKDVDVVLNEGLGRFLQKVALEPEVQQGAFIGFRIVELRPPSWWQGVDIKPGDVVTLVNGMPIEQPTEAHAAFESLRKADKLTVKYLRGSETRELTYSILDKPGSKAQPTAPAKPAS
jgi:S1-C subfamily serine protease